MLLCIILGCAAHKAAAGWSTQRVSCLLKLIHWLQGGGTLLEN